MNSYLGGGMFSREQSAVIKSLHITVRLLKQHFIKSAVFFSKRVG